MDHYFLFLLLFFQTSAGDSITGMVSLARRHLFIQGNQLVVHCRFSLFLLSIFVDHFVVTTFARIDLIRDTVGRPRFIKAEKVPIGFIVDIVDVRIKDRHSKK